MRERNSTSPETTDFAKDNGKKEKLPFVAKLVSSKGRLVIASLVLLAEYLAISFLFDAQTVGARGGVWSILGGAGRLGPLLIVGATALVLNPPGSEAHTAEQHRAPRPYWGLLSLHPFFLMCFVALTNFSFGQDEAPEGPAVLWMLLWVSLGILSAVSLFLGVLGEWRRSVQRLSRALAAGGFLGVAAWAAGSVSTELWAPLSRATFITVATVLHWMSFELFVDEPSATLELEGFAIEVAPVCSGFEGIGLFLVLMSAFLYRFRDSLRFPRALLLLPLGMTAVWFGNALRIAALMLVGAHYDPAVAVGSFHSKAGWVFFCAITLAIGVLSKRSKFFSKSEKREHVDAENPAASLLVPILVWMGIGLMTSAFSDGHDPLYGARVLGTTLVLWNYRKSYRDLLKKPLVYSVVVGLVVGVFWLLIPELRAADSPGALAQENHDLPGGGAGSAFAVWVLLRCLGAVVVIPVVEELAFRSFLPRWISNREFWNVSLEQVSPWAIAVSSIVFGLLHGEWALGVATGVVYSLFVRRTGRLIDAIVAHAVSNFLIAAWVLATGNFGYW